MSEPLKAPQTIRTSRLLLRPPVPADSQAIFARYASDPEVAVDVLSYAKLFER